MDKPNSRVHNFIRIVVTFKTLGSVRNICVYNLSTRLAFIWFIDWISFRTFVVCTDFSKYSQFLISMTECNSIKYLIKFTYNRIIFWLRSAVTSLFVSSMIEFLNRWLRGIWTRTTSYRDFISKYESVAIFIL